MSLGMSCDLFISLRDDRSRTARTTDILRPAGDEADRGHMDQASVAVGRYILHGNDRRHAFSFWTAGHSTNGRPTNSVRFSTIACDAADEVRRADR